MIPKWMWLFLFLFAGSVSSFACSHCEHEVNGWICKGGDFSGNCHCPGATRSSCAACGFCYLFICVQGCSEASAIQVGPGTRKAPEGALWLEDQGLILSLDNVSPTMANLVADEQTRLSKSWCTNFRKGGVEDAVNRRKAYRWEMFALADGSVQYRIIERDEVLIITKDMWTFERKGKLIVPDGHIDHIEAKLPPIIDGIPSWDFEKNAKFLIKQSPTNPVLADLKFPELREQLFLSKPAQACRGRIPQCLAPDWLCCIDGFYKCCCSPSPTCQPPVR